MQTCKNGKCAKCVTDYCFPNGLPCCKGYICDNNHLCQLPPPLPPPQECGKIGQTCSFTDPFHDTCCNGTFCLNSKRICTGCRSQGETCYDDNFSYQCCGDLKCKITP